MSPTSRGSCSSWSSYRKETWWPLSFLITNNDGMVGLSGRDLHLMLDLWMSCLRDLDLQQSHVLWPAPADRAKLVIRENATKQLLAHRQSAFSVQTTLPCQHSRYKTLLTPSFGAASLLQIYSPGRSHLWLSRINSCSLAIKTFLTCLTMRVPLLADLSVICCPHGDPFVSGCVWMWGKRGSSLGLARCTCTGKFIKCVPNSCSPEATS